ncbi:hypothetical protein [Ruegeria sp. HKCCA0370]|uniref:hypothetical protein n=1 Tax=Ruegeria sp. HKCCA0370 TaxID=2682995 RepID=UPI001487D7BF|nr:hypothetical protein [Ruegeria sp. HKCCA0370]
MSAPIEPKEYRVDPSRLASGTWCHTRDRCVGEGDIAASYSADKIGLEGKVRKPFVWQNSLWVCTGTHYQGDGKSAEAYQLMPERFFDGVLTTYSEVAMCPTNNVSNPRAFITACVSVMENKAAFLSDRKQYFCRRRIVRCSNKPTYLMRSRKKRRRNTRRFLRSGLAHCALV